MAEMGVTLESSVPEYFQALARRIAKQAPSNIQEILASCAQLIEEEYLANSVKEMMVAMSDQQIQQVLTRSNGKRTWYRMIELTVGSTFYKIPPPADQPLVAAAPLVHNNVEPTFVISPVGAQMTADGTLDDEFLPSYVLNAHTECDDPQAQDLTAPDVTAVLNAYTHYMITRFNQPAGDKPLRLHHAKELHKHYPKLPAHGKTPGAARRWSKLLDERKRNFARKNSLKVRACLRHRRLRRLRACFAACAPSACARVPLLSLPARALPPARVPLLPLPARVPPHASRTLRMPSRHPLPAHHTRPLRAGNRQGRSRASSSPKRTRRTRLCRTC